LRIAAIGKKKSTPRPEVRTPSYADHRGGKGREICGGGKVKHANIGSVSLMTKSHKLRGLKDRYLL